MTNDREVPFASKMKLAVLMPVRDDWVSVGVLIRTLDGAISGMPVKAVIVVVDDHSSEAWDAPDIPTGLVSTERITVVRLRRNLSHQRAIAVGLVHIEDQVVCDAVMVMDGDGEDTPEGAVELLKQFEATERRKAVFAARTRRSESVGFRVSYKLFKALHWLLTGVTVRVGNFSVVPKSYLRTLVVMSELWNHYAAALFRSRLPYVMVPIARGRRIAGRSQMNYVALMTHGLSAISVFGDIVGVRVLLVSGVAVSLAVLGVFVVATIRLFTDRAIPGWATYATGILAIIMIQVISMAASYTFAVLANRATASIIPVKDALIFVDEVVDVYNGV